MAYDPKQITYFAEADYRGQYKKFGIKAEDRTRHVYIIGKTGMGKSTLLENMAVQDIQNGNGIAFVDPHGKTADLLLNYVPEHRIKDVLYFAPFDLDHPVSFNVMEDVGRDKRHLVANGLMSAFKKIWVDAWSARMEYILNNILLALLEYPDATLIGVNRMLADKVYRKRVVDNVTDVSVKAFWEDEFAKYSERYMQEAGAAIQNKIGQFVSNPLVRNIIGQPESTFDVRTIMDEGKIMLINLSKGRIGEDNANLLGSMLITKIYLGAMSRAELPESTLRTLPNFYFFVDEFQSFANESFADILSEARKYKLNLTIAHQYIEQMNDVVRAAVIGNVGTMITFRVGSTDADVLEKEFMPVFVAADFVNLGFAQIYLKLMIDGIGSTPFSARTLGPIPEPEISYRDRILDSSRSTFAHPRALVEEDIIYWHKSHSGLISDKEKIKQAEERAQAKVEPDAQSAQAPLPAPPTHDTKPPQPKKPAFEQRSHESTERQSHKPFKDLPKVVTARKPQSEQEGREQELQKAISLTTLAQKNDEEKKRKDKSASKESMNALRDALAQVLKANDTSSRGDIQSTPQNSQKKTEEVQDKRPPAPRVPEKTTASTPGDTKHTRSDAQEQPRGSVPPSDKKSYERSVPHEIPEEDLRKMLSLDD